MTQTTVPQPRVAFATLGCKLNYAESSTLARQFEAAGYQIVPPTQEADVYVINTCSVTEHSDKKCRNIIRRLSKRNPAALVAVTGCYAQLKAEEIAAMPGVDLVVGADEKGNLFCPGSGTVCQGRRRGTHSFLCHQRGVFYFSGLFIR